MSRKFKVGDLVRVRDDESIFVAAGTEARIDQVEPDDYEGTLVYLLGNAHSSWVPEEALELVKPPTPEVLAASPLTEDERTFVYDMLLQGHDMERALEIVRTLRKGV